MFIRITAILLLMLSQQHEVSGQNQIETNGMFRELGNNYMSARSLFSSLECENPCDICVYDTFMARYRRASSPWARTCRIRSCRRRRRNLRTLTGNEDMDNPTYDGQGNVNGNDPVHYDEGYGIENDPMYYYDGQGNVNGNDPMHYDEGYDIENDPMYYDDGYVNINENIFNIENDLTGFVGESSHNRWEKISMNYDACKLLLHMQETNKNYKDEIVEITAFPVQFNQDNVINMNICDDKGLQFANSTTLILACKQQVSISDWVDKKEKASWGSGDSNTVFTYFKDRSNEDIDMYGTCQPGINNNCDEWDWSDEERNLITFCIGTYETAQESIEPEKLNARWTSNELTADKCNNIQIAYPAIDRVHTDNHIREIRVENGIFDPFKFCRGLGFDGTESKNVPPLACGYINHRWNTNTTWTHLHDKYGIASMWMECNQGVGNGCNHLNWINEEGDLNGIVRVVCANNIIVN